MTTKTISKIIFSVFIILLSLDFVFSAGKVEIVINAGLKDSNKYFINWHREQSWRDIYNWSRTQGIDLLRDNDPIVDNKAYFVSQFGSTVKIIDNRLKDMHLARMSIDFVSFKNYSKKKISSLMKITMRNIVTGYTIEHDIRFEDLSGKPYVLTIPYELLSHSKFELFFRENSVSVGRWGIWDMILSN